LSINVGTDSAGAVGKMPRYSWHNRSKSIIFFQNYFVQTLNIMCNKMFIVSAHNNFLC